MLTTTEVDSVLIYPAVDHFVVLAIPDTIGNMERTIVRVQAKDGNDRDIWYDGRIQVSVSPGGYGHMDYFLPSVAGKGNGILKSKGDGKLARTSKAVEVVSGDKKEVGTVDYMMEMEYYYANSGMLYYIADSIAPDTNTTVTFTVTAVDRPSVTGLGYLVIRGNEPELAVVYPTDELKEKRDIGAEPKMPDITMKAQLKNYNGGTVNFQWNLRVQWQGDDGRQFDDSFKGNTTATNSDVSSWTIDWNHKIRGGDEITLDVTATAGGMVYDKTVNHPFMIVGDNPDKATLKKGLSDDEQVIAYMESRFRQFWKDRDFPVFGPKHGYGLMQLDPPGTDGQVWSWKANMAEGQSRFAGKKTSAEGYPSRVRKKGGPFQYAADFAAQELLTDAFQLYNGWHYWVWTPTINAAPFLGGSWRKDPDLGIKYGRDYGGPAMQIYNDIKSGNPPSDW